MNLYHCYLHGAPGTKPLCISLHGDSDLQARSAATQLLREREDIERIEAWRDAEFVFRVSRNGIAAESGM